MAYIDYHDVRSGVFAKLSLPAKALIPVLSTLADKETAQLTKNDSKLPALQAISGMGRNPVRAGLRNLEKHKQISLTTTPGHPALITYLPLLNFIKNDRRVQNARGKEQIYGGPSEGHLAIPLRDSQLSSKNYAEPRYDYSKPERQIPCSSNTGLNTKTTTADIPEKLIKALIAKHGAEPVVLTISAMEKIMKAKPGKIKNPGGYLRDCCENGWTPTDKIIQEKEQVEERRERQRESQAKEDLAERARREQIRKDQNDPALQRKIKQMTMSFMNLKATPSQPDSEAVSSGHARPINEF